MSFKKYYGGKYVLNEYQKKKNGESAQNFRVKSPIKSFRDLDVYKQTTILSSEIFKLKIPKKFALLEEEIKLLKNISKQVPRFIAESYGDKFNDKNIAFKKLEKAMQYISDIITKSDFIIAFIGEDQNELKENFLGLVKKYQFQRIKILNLKRAWQRVFI